MDLTNNYQDSFVGHWTQLAIYAAFNRGNLQIYVRCVYYANPGVRFAKGEKSMVV